MSGDIANGDVFKISIYIYISCVASRFFSREAGKKSRLKTNLIISGFKSKFYPSKMDAFFTELFLIHQEKSPENEIFRQQKIADSIFPSFPSLFFVVVGICHFSRRFRCSRLLQGGEFFFPLRVREYNMRQLGTNTLPPTIMLGKSPFQGKSS